MRIKTLKLKSKNFEKQRSFYSERLGFKLIDQNPENFSIEAGTSRLTFEPSLIKQYYHFAFNIPSFQINEALEWAKQRVDILLFEGKEILDFKNWNAEAFYFFDEDHNIVEFIARKNLNYSSDPSFSVQSILEISEMGLPVSDINQTFQQLNIKTGLIKHSGDYKQFCAVGDESGLFIIVNETKKKWLPTEMPAKIFPFEISFLQKGENYNIICDEQGTLSFDP